MKNSSSDSDEDDDAFEEMIEDQDISQEALCLFCDERYISVENVLDHCLKSHEFDIEAIKRRLKLDSFDYIKMINFIRSKKCSAKDITVGNVNTSNWRDDSFMKPAIMDDPLLLFDIESIDDLSSTSGGSSLMSCDGDQCLTMVPYPVYEEALNLQRVTDARCSQIQADLERSLAEIERMKRVYSECLMSTSNSKRHGRGEIISIDDNGYFSGYSHFGIHEEMIKDSVRTCAFHDFIYGNPSLFRDRDILDVGCGTAILSMFAASVGARVIGVEQSDVIYNAMDIVRENGFQDTIKLVKGKLEETALNTKFDIIISEWMGYFLLYESMLETVVYARDNFLKPGGKVFPDVCQMYIVAVEDTRLYECRVNYWNDVYGFRMSTLKSEALKEAQVEVVSGDVCISQPFLLKTFDIMTCKAADVEFTSDFQVVIKKSGSVTALAAFFDISFSKDLDCPVSFSTSPASEPTHWKQTIFHLSEPISVSDGDVLRGRLTCRKMEKDHRSLDICIQLNDIKLQYVLQ